MKSKKGSGEKGITGAAKAIVGDKTFTFQFMEGDHEDERFKFKLSDLGIDTLPDDFELENGKQYFVSLNSDGSEIKGIRPVRGYFPVKVGDLARNQDEDILIIERSGDFGKYYQIIALLEILEGPYAGIRCPLYLPFAGENKPKFQDDGDGNIILVGSPEKSKGFAQLLDFVQYAIGDDTDVAFDEDDQQLLTNFLKACLKKKAKFYITLDKGYVKSMSASDDEEPASDDDDEEDKKPAKKSTSKKSSKEDTDDDDEDDDLRK